ncbi:MAG: hypothetical protein WC366_02565 [Bacilli bacterium]|jgi:excinuclease UvrABC nuclease subunit
MKQEYYLKFNDYVENPKNLPSVSGIYLIRKTKRKNDGTLSVELLYVGKAENLNDRFSDPNKHEGYVKAQKLCSNSKDNSYVSISYAECPKNSLDRVEACLIYTSKPKLNTFNTKTFDYDATTVYVGGIRKSSLDNINVAQKK